MLTIAISPPAPPGSARHGALTVLAVLALSVLFVIMAALGLRTQPTDPHLVPKPAPAPAAYR